MAKFKCKLSGFVVEFIYPVDIESTRENPAYEEVIEEEEVTEVKKVVKKTAKAKE